MVPGERWSSWWRSERTYSADRLVPITSAHLSGVSYKTIGEGGISFLEEMAQDSKVSVTTTLNPAGMDRTKWREMGISPRFADRQTKIIESYIRLGVRADCSCTPYLSTNVPKLGDSIAWAESSALSFVNSAIGARTNREGGPGALAAAILGKTPNYGLHLDENRRPSVVIEVEKLPELVDYSLLGQAVGITIGNKIPFFRGVRPTVDEMKSMAAAMAAAGSVAMFHIEGITPEASSVDLKGLERISIGRKELKNAKDVMNTGTDPELIAFGCPHLSVDGDQDALRQTWDRGIVKGMQRCGSARPGMRSLNVPRRSRPWRGSERSCVILA